MSWVYYCNLCLAPDSGVCVCVCVCDTCVSGVSAATCLTATFHCVQVELMGSSVFDYIHPADHVEMAERLGIRPHLRAEAGCHVAPESASSSASTSSLTGTPEPAPTSPLSPGNEPPDRGFFIRMKSTLTKRGLHVKSSGYKVIHVTGRIRCRPAMVPGSARSVRRPMGLVALAHTLPPSTLNEVRMESQMFVFRVNMDLQVTYCENRISEYMDLSPAEVVGHTCYHFIHVEDLDNIRQSHEDCESLPAVCVCVRACVCACV
ncbi:unnamed protein product, partial [Oncorhynchus mykiss]